jgi:hypothetical protein
MEEQVMPTPGASPIISSIKPATKGKQSKLSFTKHSGTKAEPKATSKRGRKPKAKTDKEAPKQTVKSHFKVEKVADRQVAGKPGLSDHKNFNLPELRPERKDITSPFVWTRDTSNNLVENLVVSDIPTTPEQLPIRPPSQGTISPKSVPKGMGALIDVE